MYGNVAVHVARYLHSTQQYLNIQIVTVHSRENRRGLSIYAIFVWGGVTHSLPGLGVRLESGVFTPFSETDDFWAHF